MDNERCDQCGGSYAVRVRHNKDGDVSLCLACRQKRDEDYKRKEAILRAGFQSAKNRLIKSRGQACERCGKYHENLHAHHIKKLMDGGGNTEDNLQLLCPDCHKEAHKNGTRF
jgi:5-methylcytosine-specific restriction endonuclease McrA